MVDTKDLKSFGHCGCVGSSPTSTTLVRNECNGVQVYHPAHRCIRYAVVTGRYGVTPGWSAQLVNRSDVNVSEWLIWVVACG